MMSTVNQISKSLRNIEETAKTTGFKGCVSLEYPDVDWRKADAIICELGKKFKMHRHFVSLGDGLEVTVLIG